MACQNMRCVLIALLELGYHLQTVLRDRCGVMARCAHMKTSASRNSTNHHTGYCLALASGPATIVVLPRSSSTREQELSSVGKRSPSIKSCLSVWCYLVDVLVSGVLLQELLLFAIAAGLSARRCLISSRRVVDNLLGQAAKIGRVLKDAVQHVHA